MVFIKVQWKRLNVCKNMCKIWILNSIYFLLFFRGDIWQNILWTSIPSHCCWGEQCGPMRLLVISIDFVVKLTQEIKYAHWIAISYDTALIRQLATKESSFNLSFRFIYLTYGNLNKWPTLLVSKQCLHV